MINNAFHANKLTPGSIWINEYVLWEITSTLLSLPSILLYFQDTEFKWRIKYDLCISWAEVMLGELIKFSITTSSSNSFIEGNLVIPDNPIGIVVFAHGSGSGKNSKRNQLVSEKLNKNNIATLLFDLLSDEEQKFDTQVEKMSVKVPGTVLNKFNIPLLIGRLSMVMDWLNNYSRTKKLLVGFFASSTGATAALICASRYNIVSVVIRSGRTDLVENTLLDKIKSPCLFLVGSEEKALLKISSETMTKMRNSKEKKLNIVEGASHLFEEEGTMEEVSEIATRWLAQNFIMVSNFGR